MSTIEQKKKEALELINSLTTRERQIAQLTAEGRSNEEIAEKLCVSGHTVKTHRYNIYRRLRVENNVAVAVMFTLVGLVSEWKTAA